MRIVERLEEDELKPFEDNNRKILSLKIMPITRIKGKLDNIINQYEKCSNELVKHIIAKLGVGCIAIFDSFEKIYETSDKIKFTETELRKKYYSDPNKFDERLRHPFIITNITHQDVIKICNININNLTNLDFEKKLHICADQYQRLFIERNKTYKAEDVENKYSQIIDLIENIIKNQTIHEDKIRELIIIFNEYSQMIDKYIHESSNDFFTNKILKL